LRGHTLWQQPKCILQQQLLWRLFPVHLRTRPAHRLLHGREWHFALPANAYGNRNANGHTCRYANSDSHSYTNIDSYGYANHYTQRYANGHSYAYSPAHAHCQAERNA
jgi:hypothetical protein